MKIKNQEKDKKEGDKKREKRIINKEEDKKENTQTVEEE